MANAITLSRLPILLIVVLLLFSPSPTARLISIALLIVLIALDTLDGMVARARREVSLVGSVLDVMVDRAVELVLWICYADLRLIPVAIPIIFVLRGTIVDSLRSMHVSAGEGPLKAASTPLAKWLMGSPVMRTSYGVVKLVSFSGLALTNALMAYAAQSTVSAAAVHITQLAFNVTSWVAVILCLVRGLPAVLEALLLPGQTQVKAKRA